MIRFCLAYCPCCMHLLDYNFAGNYFWCECDGWARLKWADRQKELEAAERYDRRPDALVDKEGVPYDGKELY